jgi:uncharacterized membrane protein
MMKIGILKFDGSHTAEDALQEVIDAQADENPWLHEIGIISRPLVGRLRISASFPEGKKTYRESDLTSAIADMGAYTGLFVSAFAGPFASVFAPVDSALAAGEKGKELEKKLLHLDELKKQLPRDSSALVLLASLDTIDKMVELFQSYDPKVIRRDVADELRQRLQALHRHVLEDVAQAGQEGAPAPH